MKKITRIMAMILLSILFLTACGGVYGPGAPTEEEIREFATALVEKSYAINEIYFGEGLPYDDSAFTGEVTEFTYLSVPADCPYQTEADLKAATEEVYSDAYSAYLYEIFLTGYSDEDAGTIYARYIENYGVLTVSVSYEGMTLARTYDFDTMEVVSADSKYVTVTVDSLVDGKPDVNVQLQFVNEGDGYRLDSPTY